MRLLSSTRLSTREYLGISRAEALNLRGTFKYAINHDTTAVLSLHDLLCRFLTADVGGAKADLLESLILNPSFTQSLVKLASVYMEEGDNSQAMKCFEDAIKVNEDDSDVYYHQGQGASITSLPDTRS